MKKKALSLALALVMCMGLTVSAFADTTDVDVAFSVDPIGVATIKSERGDFENVYVFDQDGTITIKDGRRFTDFYDYDLLSDLLGEVGDGGGSLGEQDAGTYADRDGVTFYMGRREDFTIWGRSPYVCSKTYLDKLIAAGYDVEFKPYTASQPTTPSQPSQPTATSFSDVKADAFYAKPVAWAVEKGVTAGTSATTFSPDATCTQGQILTFLWRAKGEPKPAGTVSGTQYYATAAQWAKEQGLTDNFSAEADCTRSMVVTYLWKLAGSPKTGTSNFSDVSANAPYAQAVAWAVGQGVTSGTSATTFSPDTICSRGQIVTFLYRAFAK